MYDALPQLTMIWNHYGARYIGDVDLRTSDNFLVDGYYHLVFPFCIFDVARLLGSNDPAMIARYKMLKLNPEGRSIRPIAAELLGVDPSPLNIRPDDPRYWADNLSYQLVERVVFEASLSGHLLIACQLFKLWDMSGVFHLMPHNVIEDDVWHAVVEFISISFDAQATPLIQCTVGGPEPRDRNP